MKTHELKILPSYFHAIMEGLKTFEIRYNDRNYQVGDEVKLREYLPTTRNHEGRYTGQFVTLKIKYIFENEMYLQPGYVVLGLSI